MVVWDEKHEILPFLCHKHLQTILNKANNSRSVLKSVSTYLVSKVQTAQIMQIHGLTIFLIFFSTSKRFIPSKPFCVVLSVASWIVLARLRFTKENKILDRLINNLKCIGYAWGVITYYVHTRKERFS